MFLTCAWSTMTYLAKAATPGFRIIRLGVGGYHVSAQPLRAVTLGVHSAAYRSPEVDYPTHFTIQATPPQPFHSQYIYPVPCFCCFTTPPHDERLHTPTREKLSPPNDPHR